MAKQDARNPSSASTPRSSCSRLGWPCSFVRSSSRRSAFRRNRWRTRSWSATSSSPTSCSTDPSFRSCTSACRRFASPKPGDIIIFKYPGDPKVDYIKRCVAVEGQTVELVDNQLFVDGVLQRGAVHQVRVRLAAGPALRTVQGAGGAHLHDGRQSRQQRRQPRVGTARQEAHRGQGDVHLLLVEHEVALDSLLADRGCDSVIRRRAAKSPPLLLLARHVL